MTPQQIDLVQASFSLVQPIAPQAAAIFYEQLFTRDPGLRRLFKGDMTDQGAKLMQMIGWAVQRLRQPDELAPLLVLAGRHRRKTRVGEDQAGHLAHTEDLLRRQEAIFIEDPPRPARGAIECTVAGKVDHVKVLIHDQERELERIARLGAHDPGATIADPLEQRLEPFRVLL